MRDIFFSLLVDEHGSKNVEIDFLYISNLKLELLNKQVFFYIVK